MKEEISKRIDLIREERKNKYEKLEKDIVIGMDLSKTSPAICVFDKKNKKLIFKDRYKQTKNKEFFYRMIEIKEWIERIIDIFKPNEAIIESAFISPKTIKSNTVLLKLHGYLVMDLMLKGLECYYITPTSARKFLDLPANRKDHAFEYTKKNFPELNLTTFAKDNDIADAAIIALNTYNTNMKVRIS